MNSIVFNKLFSEVSDCYKYISLIKWENGYVCIKCNNDKYYNGKKLFSRRCLKYKYDPTGNTMFKKLKFPILRVLHIIFKISTYQ